MQFEECIKFANDNPGSCIATIEGDQPRVRGMRIWYADKTGFYYNTSAVKELYRQLLVNPKVELCFYNPNPPSMKMLRVTGKTEFIDDLEIKKRLLEERPFLKQLGLTPENPNLIVFRIAKGEAHFWTMETTMEPKKKIVFG